jgi:uncharacterized membrane protein YhaH (DUF805 family)
LAWAGNCVWIAILAMMSPRFAPEAIPDRFLIGTILGFVYLPIVLATATLHDLDLSGWWALGFFIAYCLTVFLLLFTPTSWFMDEIEKALLNSFEMIIVHLCSKHVQPFAGMPIVVALLPENYQTASHVRFGYGMYYCRLNQSMQHRR